MSGQFYLESWICKFAGIFFFFLWQTRNYVDAIQGGQQKLAREINIYNNATFGSTHKMFLIFENCSSDLKLQNRLRIFFDSLHHLTFIRLKTKDYPEQ